MLMTYEQRGVYRELLDQQWLEGSIPSEPAQIAAMLHIPAARFTKVWPLIAGKFRPREDGRLINDRLESYRRELDAFLQNQAEKGALGAAKRWGRHSQPTARPMPKHGSVSVSKTVSTQKTTEQSSEAPAGKPPSPVREYLTWFQGEYKARRNGATYFVRWDAHSAIVKRLLTAFSADRLRKHAQILLTTDEEWTTGTDRGIEILSAKINWLEERLCAWEVKRKAREAV